MSEPPYTVGPAPAGILSNNQDAYPATLRPESPQFEGMPAGDVDGLLSPLLSFPEEADAQDFDSVLLEWDNGARLGLPSANFEDLNSLIFGTQEETANHVMTQGHGTSQAMYPDMNRKSITAVAIILLWVER